MPAVAPATCHGNLCVAIIEPAPRIVDESVWHDHVRDFIVQHHQRAVVSSQPCLFATGLFELPNVAVVAGLVQQPPFVLDDNIFVQFVHHNDRPNHRAVVGHCNDYDICNAIAAFGKFHHWHQDDVVSERTLVFVSYPSTALVPRDIVFGNYANIGGVRESWTAPCYILAPAAFAEQIPEDADQMPPNGNPHV
jgi:hypothetical protein